MKVIQIVLIVAMLALAASAIKTPKRSFDVEAMFEAAAIENSLDCSFCTFFVTKIEKEIEGNSSITEKELEKKLDHECSEYGGKFALECKIAVGIQVPKIYPEVVAGVAPMQICHDIKMCNATAAATPAVVPAQKTIGDLDCSLCNTMVGIAERGVEKNLTTMAIEGMLHEYCEKLGNVKIICDDFVNIYAPKIIAMVQNKTNPLAICMDLGLCTNSKKAESKKPAVVPGNVGGDIECSICIKLVVEAEDRFKKNMTEHEILVEMENDCAKFFPNEATECKLVIKLYGPKIINKIVQHIAPLEICFDIHMCRNATMMAAAKTVQQKINKKALPTPECMLCEVMVGKIDTDLKNDVNETKILDDLNADCDNQGIFKDECNHIVDLYGPAIINRINEDMSPLAICKDIELCKATTKFSHKSHKKSKKANKRYSATLAH